jgi:predicted PurR-regulated permease PerM
MKRAKEFLLLFLTKKFYKKLCSYLLLIFFFYFFSDFLGIFLLTFVFSYLFYTFWKYLKWRWDVFIDRFISGKKRKKILKSIFPLNGIILVEYILFIWLLTFIVWELVPQLVWELSELPETIPFVADQIHIISSRLEEIKTLNSEIWLGVDELMNSNDIDFIKVIWSKIQTVWVVFLQFLLSLVLSFVFIIDRDKLSKYLFGIKNSSFWFLYKEYSVILNKVVHSFWLIIKAQSLIAVFNTIITIIGFYFIWLLYGGFPYVLTMAIIVFLCSFIPILWMWLSAIPLTIIAFISWWFQGMIFVFFMVIFTTAFEAYFLNPKIVSHLFELPVSLTFVILIVSEHIFGIAGLLIWVSLFYFIVWLLRDFDRLVAKKHKVMKKGGWEEKI